LVQQISFDEYIVSKIMLNFNHVKILIGKPKIGFTIEWQMHALLGVDRFTIEDVNS
jgi:hypothetical protein